MLSPAPPPCVMSSVLSWSQRSPLMVLQPDNCGFCYLALLSTFAAVPVSRATWQEEQKIKLGEHQASLVELQILVLFPSLPATIYFSGSSNSYSMHSVQVCFMAEFSGERIMVGCNYSIMSYQFFLTRCAPLKQLWNVFSLAYL